MWLPDETFKSVIQHTPLISIDLIVRNEQGEVLLGKRVNAPAKGYWFVPGGRVRKNETLDDAFVRLVREELGIKSGITRADAKFLGVFEHFYDDCVFNNEISTHYIVLAYELNIRQELMRLKYVQHQDYIYKNTKEITSFEKINHYTKLYLSL
ncbi:MULTISPECIES: GDP-mannose mannosyl hydrolase [Acinetobacter]|uniref:GDP-mannose mannosyl hydrolase n=1 Tax=Acinetobacter TaxID=469 RepID=UPI000EA1833F|nr:MULTISPECIES: GDP-mannose mannosyl hydrolase [Acinetobacter]RKG42759.1 GDP-mannose mannosyl hydrolase [Acinetobacter cumulans]RZG58612.1 GDP-mannose mannosyl hydrolase [Acinetobacter sp. WCHAc060006]